MCFSATASFGASAILAVAGVLTVKKAVKSSQLFFALIPFVFSIQQLVEGFVWLGLLNNASWQQVPIHIFIFIAKVIWPIWIPLAFLLIETNNSRVKVFKIILSFGIGVAIYHGVCMFYYSISAIIIPHHIHYLFENPLKQYLGVIGVFYFLSTIVPPFISSIKRAFHLGLLNFFSFIVAVIFFDDNVISVWCFFAALISIEVYLIMKRMKEEYL